MSGKGRFSSRDSGDVIRLVAGNPLAWIFLADEDGPFATAAPVRPVVEDNVLSGLVGHVPRQTRIARSFDGGCRGLFLILGPHGYISPAWMSDRTQAPTWNYSSVQLVADSKLVDEPKFLDQHLRELTGALERGRDNAWNVDEMGSRLEQLSARIVAFEATIASMDDRFKLGQDENEQTLGEILQALELEGSGHLAALMREFNDGRC